MSKMIEFEQHGDFKNLALYLKHAKRFIDPSMLNKYGQKGVDALSVTTPVDTGKTASSWYYEIQNEDDTIILRFCNSNIVDDWCPIAIILQYGHATGTGGWVEGRDYINPAIQPLFDEIVRDLTREVRGL